MQRRTVLFLTLLLAVVVSCEVEKETAAGDEPKVEKNPFIGYGGVMLAVLMFGTYGVPVKFCPTGDGFVYQWVVCCGILTVGLIVQFFEPHTFEWSAALGGMMWCLGNLTVVPIVKVIGLGLGMLVWGSSNMITGWSIGKFGLHMGSLNLTADVIGSDALNYLGVSFVLIAMLFYFPIQPNKAKDLEGDEARASGTANGEYPQAQYTPLLDAEYGAGDDAEAKKAPQEQLNVLAGGDDKPDEKGPNLASRLVAIGGAIMAGVFYGVNMVPVSNLQQKNKGGSPLMYCASHFTGIFLASTVVMVVYCLLKKNKPVVYSSSLLPAYISGIMWGLAQSGWFLANANLGMSTSFPIITSGPGVVANIYGLVFFNEISGKRNLALLFTAFALTFIGIIIITLSKA